MQSVIRVDTFYQNFHYLGSYKNQSFSFNTAMKWGENPHCKLNELNKWSFVLQLCYFHGIYPF